MKFSWRFAVSVWVCQLSHVDTSVLKFVPVNMSKDLSGLLKATALKYLTRCPAEQEAVAPC